MENTDTTLIKVPLSNSNKHALIYEDDFRDLMQLGVTPRWSYIRDNVAIWLPYIKKDVTVARILMDAKGGQYVKYLNRDKLDLRKDNLILSSGHGKYDARTLLHETKRTKTNSQRVAS